MKNQSKDIPKKIERSGEKKLREPLTVEALEARIAPSAPTTKKAPTPAPYPPGARYGLIQRKNL